MSFPVRVASLCIDVAPCFRFPIEQVSIEECYDFELNSKAEFYLYMKQKRENKKGCALGSIDEGTQMSSLYKSTKDTNSCNAHNVTKALHELLSIH